jgi:hypothetical protein
MENIKTPLATVKEQVLINKVYPGWDVECEDFLMNPEVCENLKASVHRLIDQRVMLVELLSTVDEVATLEIPYDLTHVPF